MSFKEFLLLSMYDNNINRSLTTFESNIPIVEPEFGCLINVYSPEYVREFLVIFCHDADSCANIISLMFLFLEQFVLDVQFLVEIASYGGYFSNNPSVLVTSMKSAFLSAGLDPER